MEETQTIQCTNENISIGDACGVIGVITFSVLILIAGIAIAIKWLMD